MKNRTENISVRYRPQHLTKSQKLLAKTLEALIFLAERVGFEPTVPCGTLDFEQHQAIFALYQRISSSPLFSTVYALLSSSKSWQIPRCTTMWQHVFVSFVANFVASSLLSIRSWIELYILEYSSIRARATILFFDFALSISLQHSIRQRLTVTSCLPFIRPQ